MLTRHSGSPRCGSSASCSSARASTRSSSTARRSCSSPRATGAWWAGSAPRSTRAFNDFHDNAWGMFGFLELEDDPEAARALLDAAAELAARARARPDGRPDGLHDERRERRADRGLRPRADDPPGVAPAVLPAAAARRRGSRRRWTCSCGSSTSSDREKVLPIIWELAEQARAEARDPHPQDEPRCTCGATCDAFGEIYNEAWSRNWGFVPYSKDDLDAYAQELQLVLRPGLVHDRRGRRGRDGRDGDHRSRT